MVIQVGMDLKEDVIKALGTMRKYLTMAMNMNSQTLPIEFFNETKNYPSNIWFRNCNQYGHSDQFANPQNNTMPMVHLQSCFQNYFFRINPLTPIKQSLFYMQRDCMQ